MVDVSLEQRIKLIQL